MASCNFSSRFAAYPQDTRVTTTFVPHDFTTFYVTNELSLILDCHRRVAASPVPGASAVPFLFGNVGSAVFASVPALPTVVPGL